MSTIRESHHCSQQFHASLKSGRPQSTLDTSSQTKVHLDTLTSATESLIT